MADKVKIESPRFALPEGRVINESLFTKDQFNDKSKPAYKIEVAIPKGPAGKETETIGAVLDQVFEYAAKVWPDAPDNELAPNVEGGPLISGILDGEVLARKREKAGKEGDAYKGHWIIRASTVFNRNGDDADGGAEVYDEAVEPIMPTEKGKVYSGCYGIVGVELKNYIDDSTGNYGIGFYLKAFQKTKDGERLAKSSSSSSLFKPVGRKPGEGGETKAGSERRRRAA